MTTYITGFVLLFFGLLVSFAGTFVLHGQFKTNRRTVSELPPGWCIVTDGKGFLPKRPNGVIVSAYRSSGESCRTVGEAVQRALEQVAYESQDHSEEDRAKEAAERARRERFARFYEKPELCAPKKDGSK